MPVVRISEELFKEIQKYAEPLVDNFETALWKALKANKRVKNENIFVKEKSQITPQKYFRIPILEVLHQAGGQQYVENVEKTFEQKMKNKLLPGDYETNKDGYPKWKKAVHFQRLAMVHEGLLANNSPRGVWVITEKGKQWLSERKRSEE